MDLTSRGFRLRLVSTTGGKGSILERSTTHYLLPFQETNGINGFVYRSDNRHRVYSHVFINHINLQRDRLVTVLYSLCRVTGSLKMSSVRTNVDGSNLGSQLVDETNWFESVSRNFNLKNP